MNIVVVIILKEVNFILKPNQKVKYRGKDIPTEELSQGSAKRVICVCDFCGKEVVKPFWIYRKIIEKHNGKYACKDCFNHNEELLEKRRERTKKTCLEKYGVENPMQNEEIQKNLSTVLLEKYGVEFAGQIREGIEKRKETCLRKYGTENPITLYDNSHCHSPQVRQKAIQTCRERHGGLGFEIEENRKKAQESLASSGKVRTSSQQKYIFEVIKRLYPEYSLCELNSYLDPFYLDILFVYNGISIDVEVDGQYWHQDSQKDRKRDEVVKKSGHKVLRIKFDHIIPTDEELRKSVEALLNTTHKYNELVLSDINNNNNNT